MLEIIILLGCFLIFIIGLVSLQFGLSSQTNNAAKQMGFAIFVISLIGSIGFIRMSGIQTSFENSGENDALILTKYVGFMDGAQRSNASLTPEQRAIRDRM